MRAVRLAGLGLGLFLSACTSMMDIPPLALGPYATDELSRFDEALTLVRGRGYEVTTVDAPRGTFSVVAQTHVRRDVYTFTVQFYRGGWVQITPAGRAVRRDDDHYHLPADLGREYRDLVIALREAIGPWAGGER
ncbi:MAG: hypothetical protein U0234_32015 [Sandaracinus sp.]